MDIEQNIITMLAEVKKMDLSTIHFAQDTNFIEKINLDSFEIVSFVDKLDCTFKINFGTEPSDFDSLKSWAALLANVRNKLKQKNNHE